MPKNFKLLLFIISSFVFKCYGQVGITVSPGRIYYRVPAGGSGTQKVTVNNPNSKELEVGVSVADWDYDSLGNNITFPPGTVKKSCAEWLQVMPGSYFTLGPKQQQSLDLLLKVPADADTSIPVHTAMLYVTQLNSANTTTTTGASINVTVRMGVKLYHSFDQINARDIDVTDFRDVNIQKEGISGTQVTGAHVKCIDLLFHNTGKIWLEGNITWELLNARTGEKIKLEPIDFYSLPGDHRIVRKVLPETLKKGRYNVTAVINYGNRDELKLAELEFDY